MRKRGEKKEREKKTGKKRTAESMEGNRCKHHDGCLCGGQVNFQSSQGQNSRFKLGPDRFD